MPSHALTRIKSTITDALIWLLILFPLLTGGFWIGHPPKFEICDLGALTAIVAFWIALVTRFGRSPISVRSLSSARLGLRAWDAWRERWERAPYRATAWATALASLLYLAASLQRHHSGNSGAYDLGIYFQALWNLVFGKGYYSSLREGMNLFQDHQSPLFWAYAPLLKLSATPETLLISQSVILASGSFAVSALARQYAGGG